MPQSKPSAPSKDATKKKPAPKAVESQPRALGEDDGFGEETFARGLKAVTSAISEVARHHGVESPPKKPSPPPAKKKK